MKYTGIFERGRDRSSPMVASLASSYSDIQGQSMMKRRDVAKGNSGADADLSLIHI